MIIFILMSGIFTPYESMPEWAQKFNLINPVAYLMRINRMVMLKGSTIHDISREFYSLVVIAICFHCICGKKIQKNSMIMLKGLSRKKVNHLIKPLL